MPRDDASTRRYTSPGSLPSAGAVEAAVHDAWDRFRRIGDGELSSVYPALAAADPGLCGAAVVSTRGAVHAVGDADVEFTIMSVAKPFVFALVSEAVGLTKVRELVGVNATGLPFDSIRAVEASVDGRTNPMVNAGAIATTSLVPGGAVTDRWQHIVDGLSRFAGRRLALDQDTLSSARDTNHRNRALANLLASKGSLEGEAVEAVDLYTQQSCLAVTAVDLAVMGATLADGGVNPVTGDAVVSVATAQATLAVMTVAGMYERSGDWLLDVGVPAKSGIGGGIVSVSAGKGALGTFSPLLDDAGNSVRGQLIARHLSLALGLDMLASSPELDTVRGTS